MGMWNTVNAPYMTQLYWSINHKYMLIFVITRNTLLYNCIFLATSFGPENGPSSGHYVSLDIVRLLVIRQHPYTLYIYIYNVFLM